MAQASRVATREPARLRFLVVNALGVGDTNGIDWIELIIQVALAAVGVGITAGAWSRKSVH